MVKYLIATYCRARVVPTTDEKININDVTLLLIMIMFTIIIFTGSSTLHVASRSYMEYGVEFIAPTIFKWSEGVLVNLKEHLTKVKDGNLKKIGYGSILVSFS